MPDPSCCDFIATRPSSEAGIGTFASLSEKEYTCQCGCGRKFKSKRRKPKWAPECRTAKRRESQAKYAAKRKRARA